MEKKVNSIVLTPEKFRKFADEPQQQGNLMWQTAYQLVNLLIALEYTCVIYEDETNILVIEYEHNERFESFGVPNPVWMTEEEREDFEWYRQERNSLAQETDEEQNLNESL